MNKLEMEKELGDLIFRFKRLKKALETEDNLTPAQRAAMDVINNLRSRPVSKEVMRKTQEVTEASRAQQLANQLQKRGILGARPPPSLQPSDDDIRMWAQNNGFKTEEQLEKADSQWGNSINNWLVEATKPLNARFKDEEEERAYWDKIRVSDSGGNEGY